MQWDFEEPRPAAGLLVGATRMESPATRVSRQAAGGPVCAQCDQEMALVRIERRAFRPRTDKFACLKCGLVDEIVWRANGAAAVAD